MSKPVVFNVLKGEFQTYEEYYGKEEEHKMTKYKIFTGLGGGFGGATFRCVSEFNNDEEAEKYAYQEAVEEYESYGGLHGLRDRTEVRADFIRDNYDIDEDDEDIDEFELSDEEEEDVELLYTEEIEGWIEYEVKKCNGDCSNCNEESVCSQQNEYGNQRP